MDRFDSNSAALTPGHRAALVGAVGQITSLLRRMPTGKVLLTGHTDLVGGESANLDLGRRRGVAVGAALMQEGIPVGSVSLTSEGEAAPLVPTRDAEPRNRRVEIRFQAGAITDSPPLPAPGLGLGGPVLPDLSLPKDFLIPRGPLAQNQPDWAKPGPRAVEGPQAGAVGPRSSDSNAPTRAAGAGELFKALLATPQGQAAAKLATDTAKKDLTALKPGDKAMLATFVVATGAATAYALSTDPVAGKAVLEQLNNQEFDVKDIPGLNKVPGFKDIPGLKIRLHTAGGGPGAGLQIDLTQIFPGLK